ncbi:SLC6A5 [Symbiodinium natans]|uniref:SLC6A5 protein n=1 Tax=Symbiodinium natans TaxID=878477 RepID=A0A812I1H8_9DINO|nr:SLC6A5 [Symbiodinium natans]
MALSDCMCLPIQKMLEPFVPGVHATISYASEDGQYKDDGKRTRFVANGRYRCHNLESHGFAMMRVALEKTQGHDLYNYLEASKVLYPVAEDVLRRAFPSSTKVLVFDHIARNGARYAEEQKTGEATKMLSSSYAFAVHGDYTVRSGFSRARSLLEPHEAGGRIEAAIQQRFAFVNVWVPLKKAASGAAWGGLLLGMAQQGYQSDVPSWNGDPTTYETFETACKWYALTLRDNERKGAAARVWSRLTGPAKSVVKHLDPQMFFAEDGLSKLLAILRQSPLQTLPIPDSFSKLERWSHLRRREGETVAELLVREDELFLELQQSLARSRARTTGGAAEPTPIVTTPKAKTTVQEEDDMGDLRDFAATPKAGSPKKSQSPEKSGDDATSASALSTTNYFEDELRGYRLLKSAGINGSERQQVLTLTGNKVNFQEIRQALRALFEDGSEARNRPRHARAWWVDESEPEAYYQDGYETYAMEYDDTWDGDNIYWGSAGWEDYGDTGGYDEYYGDAGNFYEEEYQEEPFECTEEEANLMKQEGEAMALAAEANRTLTEARAAVAKVRASRGYYPLGGKGGGSGKGGASLGRGKGPKGSNCLLCGRPGHFFRDCPLRFGQGKGPGSPSSSLSSKNGKGKGKAKKGKGGYKAHYTTGNFMLQSLSILHSGDFGKHECPKFVLDTGATENAAGVRTIQALVDHMKVEPQIDLADRPTFKFGDGLVLQAKSRVDLRDTALGDVSFYVLDGDARVSTHKAEDTPLLIGSRFLHDRQAIISYQNLLLFLKGERGEILAAHMNRSTSGHLCLDATAPPTDLKNMKAKLEEAYQVELPSDAQQLLSVLTSPGALEENLRRQGRGAEDEDSVKSVSQERTAERSRSPRSRKQDSVKEYIEEVKQKTRVEEGAKFTKMSGREPTEEELDLFVRMKLLVPTPRDLVEQFSMNGPMYLCRTPHVEIDFYKRFFYFFGFLPSSDLADRTLELAREVSVHAEDFLQSLGKPPKEEEHEAIGRASHDPSSVEHSVLMIQHETIAVAGDACSMTRRLEQLRLRILSFQCASLTHDFQASSASRRPDCLRCGLRLEYVATKGEGKHRTAGPDMHIILQALHELQGEMDVEYINENAVKGKIMEVQGRRMMAGERVRAKVNMESNRRYVWEETTGPTVAQRLASAKPKARASPKAMTSPSTRPMPSTRTRTTTSATSSTMPQTAVPEAIQGYPAEDRQTEKKMAKALEMKDSELVAASEQVFYLEEKLKSMKEKLKAAKEGQDVSPSESEEDEVWARLDGVRKAIGSYVSQQPRDAETLTSASVKSTLGPMKGVEHLDTGGVDLSGLPKRKESITSTLKKRVEGNGRNYMATLLCTATVLFGLFQNSDFLEIGTNHFGSAAQNEGMLYENISQYDKKIQQDYLEKIIDSTNPSFLWASLPSHRLCWIDVDKAKWSPSRWRNFERLRRKDLQHAEKLAAQVNRHLDRGGLFAWEWQEDAVFGWKSPAMESVRKKAAAMDMDIYECIVDSCHYHHGKGEPSTRRWKILTNCKHLYRQVGRRVCPGHRNHVIPETTRVPYPEKMVNQMAEAIRWDVQEHHGSLFQALEQYACEEMPCQPHSLCENGPSVMALQRTKMPLEKPTGKKLEEVKSQMMRLHRASGHSSMEGLARLLKRRGSPAWAVEMAKELQCPDCLEEKKIGPPPPSSLEEPPALWETLGMDVFEYEYVDQETNVRMKAKLLLMIDRASRFCQTRLLKTYPAAEAWEPTSEIIKESIVKSWLAVNPAPLWVITDAARYFTSAEFCEFLGRSGVGFMVAPAEAHWLLGVEERCVQTLKRTVGRLEREENGLDLEGLFALACHGHNTHVHPSSGYSPYQWARGFAPSDGQRDVDPKKAFNKVFVQREKAEQAYRRAEAAERLSRLNNTVSRRSTIFKAGDLLMLWRQRLRSGKGGWTGPLRLLIQEGTTVWLATGATLIRAKTNQVRVCSAREEAVSSMQGLTVLRNPASLSSLLRGYQGRNYVDASQESPGPGIEEDLAPAEVRQEPAPERRRPAVRDKWEVRESALVRVHGTPRLTLFTPDKTQECPKAEWELTGKRRTIIQIGSNRQVIEDNYKVDDRPNRGLLERWTGETHFELKQKKKAEDDEASKPISKIPKKEEKASSSAGSVVKKGQLPSGAAVGPAPVTPGVVPGTPVPPVSNVALPPELEEEAVKSAVYESSSSSSSSSSEELVPDHKKERKRKAEGEAERPPKDALAVMCSIEVKEKDLKKLVTRPKKAGVWLSQRMMEKSREVSWRTLDQAQKEEFDEAQSIELSNVISSAAVRALSKAELANVDYAKVMQMRWVLTYKATGKAKARLVVLGYQAHNLTSVETTAPTLSRAGKHVLLTCAANAGFCLESGDVTSAFLQTVGSLESEELYIWAPAELAAAFGLPPDDGSIMKLTKAFYGLAHAPRRWFESVVKAMEEYGWRQSISDRCLFMLFDDLGQLQAVAGLHVDDFLIAGNPANEFYLKAKLHLQKQFKFGKWDSQEFEFAGCRIRQSAEGIFLDQEDYVNKWLSDIEIPKARANAPKAHLTPSEISSVRAALGTLAWKASQSGLHHQAEVSLFLSEIPTATVQTMININKLIREVRKEAKQGLWFPAWGKDWRDIAAVVWADASQSNRPNKSSTVGYVGGFAPRSIMDGTEEKVAVVAWKSGKAPRESLGSNGSEVQAITMGEDMVFLLRAMWLEVHGGRLLRGSMETEIRENTHGCLVMDSRGVYDAATRNLSALHGLRSSRAGYELTVSVQQAQKLGTCFRWVNGLSQLADGMTKAGAKKGFLHFFLNEQRWSIVYDATFTAGRKIHQAQLKKQLAERERMFVLAIQDLAREGNYPWAPIEDQSADLDASLLRNLREMVLMSGLCLVHTTNLQVERDPLGLIEWSSQRPQDVVSIKFIYPHRTGEIYRVLPSDHHRWVYYPDMAPGECLVFKVIYLARYIINRHVLHKRAAEQVSKGDDGKEHMSSMAYIFSLLGYAIGIGNVWRFPYVISQNGGAAAVIAYLTCAILVAWPLFIYEMILGQYLRKTFVETWIHIRPRWASFAWAQFLLLFIAQTYFSVVITYTLPYIAASCEEPLPWTETSASEFWSQTILNSFPDLNSKPPGFGPIQWRLALSLVVFWLITYLCVAFGKNILAQITYVTVIMPVVLMVILVVVTTQQEGAIDGIQYYIGKFEVAQLARLDVWATALSQILFSLSPGFGTAITYSSFVKPKEDVYRAGLIVAASNSAFSLLGGIAVFSMVGHLAREKGLPVEDVATKSGTGLAFIVISEAMTLFGGFQNVMSVLFFVMLFTLGLDCSYAWTETIVSSVEEFLGRHGYKRPLWQTTLLLCTIMCSLGLVFTTRMGNNLLDVIDMFVGTIFLLVVCCMESIILNCDVGWKRLACSLKAATTGNKHTPEGRNLFPRCLCRIDLHLTVPAATGLLCLYQIIHVAQKTYGGYPSSLVAWGWTLLATCVVVMCLTIWKRDAGSLPAVEADLRFKGVVQPDEERSLEEQRSC